jgi:hypothetical protein
MGRKRPSARVRANRLNAKKSTGPKTPGGKKRSSYNSFLHGLSSDKSEFHSHPETDKFIKLLCEGDERPHVIKAAREVCDAQFWLNTTRQYKNILEVLKSRDQNTPLPASEVLDDPFVSEFIEYMSTGEPASFGPSNKSDYRLHNRFINFIFKQSRQSKIPDLERKKLYRYERTAIRRRLVAIEKFDEFRRDFSSTTCLHSSRGTP